MDNPLIYKLLEELRLQCRFAQIAFKELPKAIQMNDPERAFFHVHAFLAHAVNISKLLWASDGAAKLRASKLRTELRLADTSPLELKELRELLDHHEERLAEWAETAEHRNFVAINLMPVGTLEGFKADSFHRTLDTETMRGAIQGVAFDLPLLSKELQKLDRAAENWLKTHSPW